MQISSILVMIVSLFFHGSVLAAECPDISGTYISEEGAMIKFEQKNCQTLKRYFVVPNSNGSVSSKIDREFQLDGTPVCYNEGACELVQAAPAGLEFRLTFNGSVRTAEHGLCGHRGYKLSLDTNGNLVANFDVGICSDGFQGQVQKIFDRL